MTFWDWQTVRQVQSTFHRHPCFHTAPNTSPKEVLLSQPISLTDQKFVMRERRAISSVCRGDEIQLAPGARNHLRPFPLPKPRPLHSLFSLLLPRDHAAKTVLPFAMQISSVRLATHENVAWMCSWQEDTTVIRIIISLCCSETEVLTDIHIKIGKQLRRDYWKGVGWLLWCNWIETDLTLWGTQKNDWNYKRKWVNNELEKCRLLGYKTPYVRFEVFTAVTIFAACVGC
jgi:hypothetical protein